MRSIISQSVVLPAPAESLFAMYTDPAKHAAITGAPVAISAEPGSPFRAFNGAALIGSRSPQLTYGTGTGGPTNRGFDVRSRSPD